jgi:protocatechuate 3,4-dioxygenase beta subunit
MSPAAKLGIALIALAAAVIAFAVFFNSSDPTTIGPTLPQVETPPASQQTDETTPDRLTAGPERTPTTVRDEARVDLGAGDAPQGVTGRVLAANGMPLPGVRVYLQKAAQANLAELLANQQRNVQQPPVAESTTDDAGVFRLGLRRLPDNRTFDLHLVDDEHADRKVPNITIFPEQWFQAGDLRLDLGATVTGRVTVAGSGGLPIEGATVEIQPVAFPTAGTIPGRESGLVATSDAGGYFEARNVPEGSITISAVADGYAIDRKLNVQVERSARNDFVFELQRGLSIAGIVVDATGKPVAQARLTARALSSKKPMQREVASDERGRFDIDGLLPGPYEVQAIATGFVADPIKPVEAGTPDLQVTLEQQGVVLLRVVGRNGQAVTNYSVTPKQWFPDRNQHGNIPGVPVHRVVPGMLQNGRYAIGGLDPKHYIFEVVADNYAKTFSEPVSVVVGGEPPSLDVRLLAGGRIEGVVADAQTGRPVEGALVKTLPNFVEENPLFQLLGAMVPYKVTQTQTTTDSQGRFRMTTLAPGTYQIKISHPEYSGLSIKDQELADEQTLRLDSIALDRGTEVIGTAMVDGVPSAQVRVIVSPTPGTRQEPNPTVFSAEAITDETGSFRLQRRLPPGRYQAMAAQQTAANPLLGLVNMQKSRQEFEIVPGQAQHELRFTLTSN